MANLRYQQPQIQQTEKGVLQAKSNNGVIVIAQ
jgi:hypothetical protein